MAGLVSKHIAETMGLRHLFDEIDLNVSGTLDMEEFRMLLVKMGEVMEDEEIFREFNAIREAGAWVRPGARSSVRGGTVCL